MDAADILLKCEVCGGKMKEPKILPCVHSFCYSCLKDRVMKDKENKLKCPRCLEECRESVEDLKTNTFIELVVKFKTCGVCKQKETDFLCKDCDDFFCSSCVDVHNKLKLSANHTIVKLSDGPVKNQSKPSLFCIDCDQFLASESVNSHKKHELTDKNEGIKRRLSKWEGEVKRLTESNIEFKECLKNDKYKWSDKRRELLELKSRLEDNYQELIEVLQYYKKLESDKIDAKVSSMEKEFLEQEKKITKEMSSFNAAISKTNDKMKNLKNGLKEGFRDESSHEMTQKHPPPPLNLKHHLSFKEFSKEEIPKHLPSIQIFRGQYELELERPFRSDGGVGLYYVRHDRKFLYAVYHEKDKIDVHSLDNFQLLKTIRCQEGFKPWDVICIKNAFYVISFHQKKMLIFDENGALSEEIKLPSNGWYLKNGGSGKLMVTCNGNNVRSYDVDARKLEAISTPPVQVIHRCCSMDDKYCMWVKINDCSKVVTCNHASIIKSYDVGQGSIDICTNDKGYAFVVDDANKMVLILDGDLQLVSSFPVDSTGELHFISIDSDLNIYLSILDSSKEFYNIRKYKMK